MPLKRISTSHLAIGMYVSDKKIGDTKNSLLEKGFILRDETLAKIRNNAVTDVIIDTDLGKDSEFARAIETAAKTNKCSASQERGKAERVYKDAVSLVGNLLADVKLGKAIDVGPVKTLADDINNSVLNNENALLCLSQIREKDQYLLEHSINVGILMGIFARFLAYDKDTVHQLVTGALLHDIGKIRVPNHILNKPGKLTDDEWQEMKNHVEYGEQVLLKSEGISEIALSVCALHHERLDGSGYPKNLIEHDINIYGRMAAIVDVYDAITADRVYHDGKSPASTMKFLVTLTESHLDKTLVYDFIRCMSVYPVGSLVELSNGKIGVVIEITQEPAKPIVRTFYNSRRRIHEPPAEFDLSKHHQDISIAGICEPKELGLDPKKFI